MKNIISDLYNLNRCLLGEGYDNALLWINKLIPLDIIEIPSGTKIETWEVPQEWIVKDAWVKFNGEKIIDYKKDPLSLTINSIPVHGIVNREELKKHLSYSDDRPDAFSYTYKYYENDWGFSLPKNKFKKKIEQACEGGVCVPELKKIDPLVGKIQIQGQDYSLKYEDLLKEGDYEVFIDTEFKPGTMKIGVHTILGKEIGTIMPAMVSIPPSYIKIPNKEILLFAHLDHPFQANDNLSGVACLIDLAKQIKEKNFDHTVKLIFCPETIGSIAYIKTQDVSNVDFVIALDAIGNNNTLLIQKAFNETARINYAVHLATSWQGVSYRKGQFRLLLGSDEYPFNDPTIGIPGVLLSRYPYKEYHTSEDTPEIINEEKLKEVQKVILKTIEIYEKDFIPIRNFKLPLMRTKYGMHSDSRMLNRDLDLLYFLMDGKKYLSEIIMPLGLSFDYGLESVKKLEENDLISRFNNSKTRKHKAKG